MWIALFFKCNTCSNVNIIIIIIIIKSVVLCAAGAAANHWALLQRGNKVFAVPLQHFFTFKRERVDNGSVDEALRAQEEAKKLAERVDASFRKKFGVKDEDEGWLCYTTLFGAAWKHATEAECCK
jgi:hypothetical protein